MSDTDIEQLLLKGENESPLTIIDDVPIESEDVHIVYRVAKQTRFEATAEKGVCRKFVFLTFSMRCFFSLWFYLIIQLMHH
jgi:hypothetical protein